MGILSPVDIQRQTTWLLEIRGPEFQMLPDYQPIKEYHLNWELHFVYMYACDFNILQQSILHVY